MITPFVSLLFCILFISISISLFLSIINTESSAYISELSLCPIDHKNVQCLANEGTDFQGILWDISYFSLLFFIVHEHSFYGWPWNMTSIMIMNLIRGNSLHSKDITCFFSMFLTTPILKHILSLTLACAHHSLWKQNDSRSQVLIAWSEKENRTKEQVVFFFSQAVKLNT